MPWRGWVWAAMSAVALMTVAGANAAEIGAVDCWLLDESRKGQAAERGLCGDAFSRNAPPAIPSPRTEPNDQATASLPGVSRPDPPPSPAPLVNPPRKPPIKAASPRPRSTARSTAGGPHLSHAPPARNTGGDFITSFQRDLGALVNLLAGGPPASNRRRTDGTASLPTHMDHSGR